MSGEDRRLACPECGNRQLEGRERCTSCGYIDGLLSLDNPEHVDLLRDIDQARFDKHEKRMRLLAVVVAMVAVFALWAVPGFWKARQESVALPFLIDQWALMIVIAFGITLVMKRTRPKPLFPYVS
ncbi:MAG TPA: hypothetical protein VMZ53_18740 [Kofleriaceae bacterium]|nr:hypothetical protein [Kofleriaceae bacterium]